MVYAALATCLVERRTWRPILVVAILVYGIPMLALFGQMRRIKQSEWGRRVLNGIIFRTPYPAVRPLSKLYTALEGEIGPSTMPERMDVLIGTRLASPYLGSMTKWLDYHPGNVAYVAAIRQVGRYFNIYRELPSSFQDSVITHVGATHGRMLKQDWQTGFWRLMDPSSCQQQIIRDILFHSNSEESIVGTTIDQLLSRSRFDVSFRDSALAYHSQLLLMQLRIRLTMRSVDLGIAERFDDGNALAHQRRKQADISTSLLPSSASRLKRSVVRARPSTGSHATCRWVTFPTRPYRIGDTVLAQDGKNWARATILDIGDDVDSSEQLFDLGYEWGEDEEAAPLHGIRPIVPMVAGAPVACRRRDESMADAIITDVHPDLMVNLFYLDNGEVEEDVDVSSCFRKG
jgi:hypothetical protein